MGQFTFPHTVRDSVLHWIDAIPGCSVESMERSTYQLQDSTWNNYRCLVGDAVALVSISEHKQLPGRIVVTVSTDLRRIWRLTRLIDDFRLANAIAGTLKRHGGREIVDEQCPPMA